MHIDSCQFVVTASRNYSLHLSNPDILVDWKSIEQIVSVLQVFYKSILLHKIFLAIFSCIY